MIYSYGVSLPGTDHIKNGIVCQDAHKIAIVDNNIAIAAVADGLGSAKYSDVGSKLAVENAVEMCARHITGNTPPSDILKIIRAGYVAANSAVENEAASQARSVDQYDTTLSLAVLIRDTLYYGHSGDGGIIALATDGLYMQVTRQQRDSEGRVFPLFFQDKWEFNVYEKRVSAVLLATDGMYEPFFPIFIKNDPVNIYVHLAQFFMDHRQLDITRLGNATVSAHINKYMQNIPAEQISDDKTVAVLINPSIATACQPEAYYSQINWDELKRRHDEEWKRAAYPDMFKASVPRNTEQQAFEKSLPHSITFGSQKVMDPPTKVCAANFCHPLKKGDCDTTLCERFNWRRNMPNVNTQASKTQAKPKPAAPLPKQMAWVVQKESSKKRLFWLVVIGLSVVLIAMSAVISLFFLFDSDEVDAPYDPITVVVPTPAPAEPPPEPVEPNDVKVPGDNDDGQEEPADFAYENEVIDIPADIPYRAFVHAFGYIYSRGGYADIPRGFERLPLSWEDFLRQYSERIIDIQFAISANVRNFGNIYNEDGNASFPDEFDREPILWEDFLDQYGFCINYTECILRRFPEDVEDQAAPYRARFDGVYFVYYDRGYVDLREEVERFYPPPEWSRFVELYAHRISFIDYILRINFE